MNALTSILQNRESFVKEIAEGVNLQAKLLDLLKVSAACFAIYGAIIGYQKSGLQALSSSVKLPILFLLTAAICMPTLYIFSSFFGSKRDVMQTLVLLAAGLTIISISLVGFAPITLFFIMTARNYEFFKILNVVFFSISGFLGISFFARTYNLLDKEGPESAPSRQLFLKFWMVLFAFVGTQLGWTLRPFFGSPDMDFEIVREIGGNFYIDIFHSIQRIFSESAS